MKEAYEITLIFIIKSPASILTTHTSEAHHIKPTCRSYGADHHGYQYIIQVLTVYLLKLTKLFGLTNHGTSSHTKNTYYTNRHRESLTTYTPNQHHNVCVFTIYPQYKCKY
jgi:hypothetical protein